MTNFLTDRAERILVAETTCRCQMGQYNTKTCPHCCTNNEIQTHVAMSLRVWIQNGETCITRATLYFLHACQATHSCERFEIFTAMRSCCGLLGSDSKVLWNLLILWHHYVVPQPRKKQKFTT